MSVRREHKEPINQDKIDLLQQTLVEAAQRGTPRFYKITIDGIPVVGKTSDETLFDSFKEKIRPQSRELTIELFSGNGLSPWCDRYVFDLKEDSFSANASSTMPQLGAVQEMIDQSLHRSRLEWDLSALMEKHQALLKDYEISESYCDQLEAEIEALKNTIHEFEQEEKRGEILGKIVEQIGDKALAFFGKSSTKVPDNPSIQLSGEQPKVRPVNNEQNVQESAEFLKKFNPEETAKIYFLLTYLSENKHQLDEVLQLLDINTQLDN